MLNRVLPDQFRLCTSSSQTPDQRASAEPRPGPPEAAEQDAGEPTAVDGWKQVRAEKSETNSLCSALFHQIACCQGITRDRNLVHEAGFRNVCVH